MKQWVRIPRFVHPSLLPSFLLFSSTYSDFSRHHVTAPESDSRDKLEPMGLSVAALRTCLLTLARPLV